MLAVYDTQPTAYGKHQLRIVLNPLRIIHTHCVLHSTHCVLHSARAHSFIGWLKNFITDRNQATQNLIDSYTAVTLVRRAPTELRTSLLSRWTAARIVGSGRSFLLTAKQILNRSRGRAGLHEVQIPLLASFNSRLHKHPAPLLQQWFDNVEQDLSIRQLNSRGTIRKNGYRIPPQTYVSYYQGHTLCLGMVVAVYVGSRPSAPFVAGCAVCTVRQIPACRLRCPANFTTGEMFIVSSSGGSSTLEYVCSTTLLHQYVRCIWDDPEEENLFAMVRMEAL